MSTKLGVKLDISFQFEIDDLPTNTLKELVFLEVIKFKK